jgi:hypothetical protein
MMKTPTEIPPFLLTLEVDEVEELPEVGLGDEATALRYCEMRIIPGLGTAVRLPKVPPMLSICDFKVEA